ncbi:uncharacterized protein LOC108716494 isoform X2 [Xenopus laevis]|uniref:Uncharacterized protein LOC108716494 isoform X2 n=1 Tax=Xenopus laevis TaxID=8355 RepID=A0A8J0VF55_XENLA|nr:uncharacterized protein LOC108716494 isoform X2 [Xenopus laevis]
MAKQCINSKDDVSEKKHDLKEKIGELKQKKDKLKEEEDELKEKEDELNGVINDINKNIGDIKNNTSNTEEQTGDINGNKDDVKMPVQETGDYADHSATYGILHTKRPKSLEVCPGAEEKRELICPDSSAKKSNIQPAAGNGSVVAQVLVKRTGKHKHCRKKKEKTKETKALGDLKLPSLPEIMVVLMKHTFSALISVRWSCWLRFIVILLSISATSSSSCSSCQIFEFCTEEKLLDQPLTISIEGKENYCSFQFTAHSATEKCNKSEVKLNKRQMCVLLSMTGLIHDNLYLEYGTGRTTPILAVPAGCCENSPTTSDEVDFSIQNSAPLPTHNMTGAAVKDPGQIHVAAIIVPIVVGIALIVFVVYKIRRKISKQGTFEHLESQTPPNDVSTDEDAVSKKNCPEEDHREDKGDALSPMGIPLEEHPEMNLGTSSSPQDGEIEPRDDDATKSLLIPNMDVRKSNGNNIY